MVVFSFRSKVKAAKLLLSVGALFYLSSLFGMQPGDDGVPGTPTPSEPISSFVRLPIGASIHYAGAGALGIEQVQRITVPRNLFRQADPQNCVFFVLHDGGYFDRQSAPPRQETKYSSTGSPFCRAFSYAALMLAGLESEQNAQVFAGLQAGPDPRAGERIYRSGQSSVSPAVGSSALTVAHQVKLSGGVAEPAVSSGPEAADITIDIVTLCTYSNEKVLFGANYSDGAVDRVCDKLAELIQPSAGTRLFTYAFDDATAIVDRLLNSRDIRFDTVVQVNSSVWSARGFEKYVPANSRFKRL